MLNEIANHAIRIQRYIERYSEDRVESFVDLCLSIENMIDHHAVHVRRYSLEGDGEDPEMPILTVPKLLSKPYLDRWVNPPEFLEELKRKFPPRKRFAFVFAPVRTPRRMAAGYFGNDPR